MDNKSLEIYFKILYSIAPLNFVSDQDEEALPFNNSRDISNFIDNSLIPNIDQFDEEEALTVLDRLTKLYRKNKMIESVETRTDIIEIY
jgi:hypothetical protein